MTEARDNTECCINAASTELKLSKAFIFSVPILLTFVLLLLLYLFYLRRRRVDWSSLGMRSSVQEISNAELGLKKELREMLPIIVYNESFCIKDTQYIISFLKEHRREVYLEVRAAYIDTMNKVLSAHLRAYMKSLEKLQLDIATSGDMIGVDTRSSSLFYRGREPLKNRSAIFALGERMNILKEIDQPAIIPHIAEAISSKYPYEVLFRSLHKLLMDTASSEYLFCDEFFGEESIFNEIFAGPFAVIDEHFNLVLPNCYDAIGIMLMIRIIHQHQLIMSRRRIPCLDSYLDKVNIALWPRFKMVFDMHLSSLRNANIRTLWEDDVRPHYVMRRYAEFTASLIQLNVGYGDGQLELNLDRLRMSVDDLLVKLAKLFPKTKLQTVFLINNYDMTIAIVKESGPEGGKIQMHFEDLLKSNIAIFVDHISWLTMALIFFF